jgi:hypothetical protein
MENGRIHSVDLLNMAFASAMRLGYRLREVGLDGFAGGACQVKGQKWLFVDPVLSVRDRLELILEALAADPATSAFDLPAPLAAALSIVQAKAIRSKAG